MGLADPSDELDSRISVWSDEDEMTALERVLHRDYLLRVNLDLQGGPIFTVKVIFILEINVLSLS